MAITAHNQVSISDFNDAGVQAPLPGEPIKNYDNTPEPEPEQTPLPVQPEPEPFTIPQPDPEPVTESAEEIFDRLAADQAGSSKKRPFAELRRQAEAEAAANLERSRQILARAEGLAEFANQLEQDPELAERVGQVYAEYTTGQQRAPVSRERHDGRTSEASSSEVREVVDGLKAEVAELRRTQTNANLRAAAQIVQGRHHLTKEDFATVVHTAVVNGMLKPNMLTADIENALENARKIAFYERAKSDGEKQVGQRITERQKVAQASAAQTGGQSKVYDVRGKSFADIRREAKIAGLRGL